ncbi:MAG: hypothetical protein ABJF11_01640 [Reichenbachiella sp.]|uniref:hypothetical protein n=1 Tax=Reichenbachiella sp. TaxID=2184521 RepID=UPI003267B81D
MEARETDKLFRDKLKQMGSTPNEDSWAALESKLDQKKATPWFSVWRVAAMGLILLASAAVIYYGNRDQTLPKSQIAQIKEKPSESIQPSNTIIPETGVEEKKAIEIMDTQERSQYKVPTNKHTKDQNKTKQERSKSENTHARPENPAKEVHSEAIEDTNQMSHTEQLIAQSIDDTDDHTNDQETSLVASTEETDGETSISEKKYKPIRITYKRGNNKINSSEKMIAEQKADSTDGGKLKEFFAQTREIKPGDFWADIREAKDNLFQRKENSKKNNVKNLNK